MDWQDVATSLEPTLAVAQTTSEAATFVAQGAAYVGSAADGVEAWNKCGGGWTAECAYAAGGLLLDAATFGGDRFISEFTIWKPIYAGATSSATLLYGQFGQSPAEHLYGQLTLTGKAC